MIPKLIHYCWFGNNPLPDIVLQCMESWKKMCPDYQIQLWNEKNFDVNCCTYVREAYDKKKWAFVSDVARIKVLDEYGGIYVDTDVEILKPLDELLNNKAFMGFQYGLGVNTGLIMGSEANHPILKEHLSVYDDMKFVKEDGSIDTTTCVDITTDILAKHGLELVNKEQIIGNVKIFPMEYFCPMNPLTGKIKITNNSYSIHRFIGSWADDTVKQGNKIKLESKEQYGLLLGFFVYAVRYSMFVLKKEGIKVLLKKIYRRCYITIFRKDIN